MNTQMHRQDIPQWAINLLDTKGFRFEPLMFNQTLWSAFLEEFPPQTFSEEQLISYFPVYVDSLIDNNRIGGIREASKRRPKPLRLSALEEAEMKIFGFFHDQSLEGEQAKIVKFDVVAECPFCAASVDVHREAFAVGWLHCQGCGNRIRV